MNRTYLDTRKRPRMARAQLAARWQRRLAAVGLALLPALSLGCHDQARSNDPRGPGSAAAATRDDTTAGDAGVPAPASPEVPKSAVATPAAPAGAEAALPKAASKPADVAKPVPADVKIAFRTIPNVGARIRHGSKTLGVIPRTGTLTVKRPRDSGPLDVVISAKGFLTVHTRAHTFSDNAMEIKLTPAEEKEGLFGFRKPLEPEDAGAPAAP